MMHGGVSLSTLVYSVPRGTCTPPPFMAGFSVIAPPYMVTWPNGLVFKKNLIRVKFKICFKFGLKIKKHQSPWPEMMQVL
jgi:hypothetical protein